VQFQAEASDPEGTSLAYSWDFGDGSDLSSMQNPIHIYDDAGIFRATCTVTDHGSPIKRISKNVTITVSAPVPTISALKPAWKVAHLPEFTFTVRGTNFIRSSKIVFNGVEKTTQFVNSSEIKCKITPEDTNVFAANTISLSELNIKAISESAIGVWVRNPFPGGDSQPLNFTVKSGHAFSTPQLLCSDADGDYKLLFGRYLYLVYSRGSGNNWKIIISKDDGNTWYGGYELPYSQNSSAFSIAADNRGVLYLINLSGEGNDKDIVLSSSDDQGANWTSNRLISAGTPDTGICSYTSRDLNITALNDDSLHVAWMEQSIGCSDSKNYYIHSTDHGETWSERRKMPDMGAGNVYYPLLIGKGYGFDTLHYVFYMSESIEWSEKPYYQYSKDKGLTWSIPTLIDAPSTYSAKIPAVGLNDYLYLTYSQSFHGFWSLAPQVSIDHGQSWHKMQTIIGVSGGTIFESLSFLTDTADNLNILWYSLDPVEHVTIVINYRRKISLANLDSGWDQEATAAKGYKFRIDS
jgi:PKD repeat protein